MTNEDRERIRAIIDHLSRQRCKITKEGKADVYCAAIGTNSSRCRYRARPGSQYCGQHQGRTG